MPQKVTCFYKATLMYVKLRIDVALRHELFHKPAILINEQTFFYD